MGFDIVSSKVTEQKLGMVFVLKGSLDTDTHELLEIKINKAWVTGIKEVILDLGSLEYISSMGISAVVGLRKKLAARDCRLNMVNVPKHIARVFEIVKALPDMKIFSSVQEVDEYLMDVQNNIRDKQS